MDRESIDDVAIAADGAAEDLPFRELAKHLATPCWISDAEGVIVWVNDAWLAYTGVDVETIRAEGLKTLHDPTVYGDVVRKWMAMKAAGVADEMTFPLRGKDGRLRPFHTRVVPLRDSTGRITRWFGTNTDISAQSQTEAQLRSREEQWREVFDRAGDGIFITDAEGRLVEVNDAACAMAQRTRQDLLAMSVWDLIDRGEHGALADARRRDDSFRDWLIKRKDGTFLEVEVSSRRLSDGGRIGVARDVSMHRLAEAAERQALTSLVREQAARASDAERQLQHFWDASSDLFAIVSNTDGVPQLINDRAWEATLGFPAAHIKATRLMDLVHPDDRERTRDMRRAHRDGRAYFGFENRYLRSDGGIVWLSWNVMREDDLIFCSARDITRQKADQEALANRERELRLFAASVVDYALIMLNPAGEVIRWNAGAERIKGYTADEIIGRHVSVFYTEADRAAGAADRALSTAAEQGRYETESWRVRKDGALFWANVIIDAIRDADGQLLGFAKITRDITERRNAQLELERANQRLAQSQKMEALGQLTGGVAHDFNNLLMVMGGQSELLRSRTAADERAARSLDAIATAVKRGKELTSHLLAFARRQRLKPAPISLAARMADLAPLLRSSLGGSIALEVDCAEDLWPVDVDANAWEVAVLNMAVNARDAMPDGGRLRITARNVTLPATEAGEGRPGDFVEMTVADTGCGIPADIIAKVIEPFFTTKDVNKGTGLGLSQVDGFVQQSGGRMSIESELGHGTTIRICLPRADMEPAHEAPATQSSGPRRLNVLCVEDNPEVADVAAGLLEQLGHGVHVVGSAAAAERFLEESRPVDLVFTDVVMAGDVNGLGLARRIREKRPSLPILLVTGYSREAEAIGDEFPVLAKPYELSDLSSAIQAAAE
jgi:PAS domain S-box-containing protein